MQLFLKFKLFYNQFKVVLGLQKSCMHWGLGIAFGGKNDLFLEKFFCFYMDIDIDIDMLLFLWASPSNLQNSIKVITPFTSPVVSYSFIRKLCTKSIPLLNQLCLLRAAIEARFYIFCIFVHLFTKCSTWITDSRLNLIRLIPIQWLFRARNSLTIQMVIHYNGAYICVY